MSGSLNIRKNIIFRFKKIIILQGRSRHILGKQIHDLDRKNLCYRLLTRDWVKGNLKSLLPAVPSSCSLPTYKPKKKKKKSGLGSSLASIPLDYSRAENSQSTECSVHRRLCSLPFYILCTRCSCEGEVEDGYRGSVPDRDSSVPRESPVKSDVSSACFVCATWAAQTGVD